MPSRRSIPCSLRYRRLLAVPGGLLVLFLALPLVALIGTSGPEQLWRGLNHPLVVPALGLSLLTTALSLACVLACGTPLALWLARGGRLRGAIETLIQVPVVIPPAVAGVALLLAFGRRGLMAPLLAPTGWSVPFTTAAVVVAQIFVAAPFFLQAAAAAFRRVDAEVVIVAKSLGATPWQVFSRIVVPLAAPGLAAGAAMCWARALGEFGATLMFAGNLTGRTQTLPLAIYTALESDFDAAKALSVVLLVIAALVLLVVRRGAWHMPLPGPVPRSR